MADSRIRQKTSYSAAQIAELIEASYNVNTYNIEGFTPDRDLSDKRVSVYRDDKTGKAIAVHRGSNNAQDWRDNWTLLTSGRFESTKTYQLHKKRQERINAKYGSENVTLIGHSRAGGYVEHLNSKDRYAGAITSNKAANWSNIGQQRRANQTDIRSNYDIVSALTTFQRGGTDIRLHDQAGGNLIRKHSTKPLKLSTKKAKKAKRASKY